MYTQLIQTRNNKGVSFSLYFAYVRRARGFEKKEIVYQKISVQVTSHF